MYHHRGWPQGPVIQEIVGASSSDTMDVPGTDMGDRLLPKLVVFDLDGCLWKPEMYELLYFSGGYGSPFVVSPDNPDILLTNIKREPVYLLGDVRDVMRELYQSSIWEGVAVGISSRTDQPIWARELLEKFVVDGHGTSPLTPFTLRDVINGPVQIASDSKVDHFLRIHKQTTIPLDEMMFFDNEWANCKSVASLGVTVGFTPYGVTRRIFDATLQAFPAPVGSVVRLPE